MEKTPSLADALAEIEKTQRNTQRLIDASYPVPSVALDNRDEQLGE